MQVIAYIYLYIIIYIIYIHTQLYISEKEGIEKCFYFLVLLLSVKITVS